MSDEMQIDAVMWPDVDWSSSAAEWRLAEQLGIRRGWVYDHLNLGPRHEQWHEATTYLAAVAASTSTIGIGTMVTTPNFRHPAVTAKSLLTLNHIAGGRVMVGVGAGGVGGDSEALGGPVLTRAERMERLHEWTHQLRTLMSVERVDARGRWSSVHDIRLGGSPALAPPLAVAGTGPKGMRLAAEVADVWITQDIAQDVRVAAPTAEAEVARQLAILDAECDRVGRDPATLRRLAVLGYGSERPLASRAALVDAIERYHRLGVTTIAVLWPRGREASAQLAMLADVIGQVSAQ
jgi:alkanesulfonate monooxygenase SsuD/methylene tetrahydromethanopterin reductase-like flavin-dependent oxidoreductase (luciferase family)